MQHIRHIYMIPTVLAEGTAEIVLSPQIKEVISSLDYFFVEEIRTARRFISSLKIGKPIDALKFIELNKDTPRDVTYKNLLDVPNGMSIGVISESGCPGIADPGAVVVEMGHELGFVISPLVGPSSILLALMGSGLNGQKFCFHGYLPIDKKEKEIVVKQLEKESKLKNQTQIFMETPYRNLKMLEEILPILQGNTKLCIASNITSENQYIKTMTVQHWRKNLPDIHKSPCIFLLYLGG